MIKKLFIDDAENQVLEGTLILFFLGLFVYINKIATGFKILDLISILVLELFMILVLSIIIEEIYLNIKKMHFWILFIAIIFVFTIVVTLLFSGSFLQIILLSITSYLLIHRFNRVKKIIKNKK